MGTSNSRQAYEPIDSKTTSDLSFDTLRNVVQSNEEYRREEERKQNILKEKQTQEILLHLKKYRQRISQLILNPRSDITQDSSYVRWNAIDLGFRIEVNEIEGKEKTKRIMKDYADIKVIEKNMTSLLNLDSRIKVTINWDFRSITSNKLYPAYLHLTLTLEIPKNCLN